jgi:hypothetical protein
LSLLYLILSKKKDKRSETHSHHSEETLFVPSFGLSPVATTSGADTPLDGF